ncbi:hypothetical protein EIP91_010985 [Steccherinum ochraceum]|uniref:Uncharacterized protein n=1 Tax=Steccherinum ochraceum TaxID=92696 RepID=A0A4V2MX09_9APHY|nr:hypothetical protein EIP91_010985 [Steccherinum ochraceum]
MSIVHSAMVTLARYRRDRFRWPVATYNAWPVPPVPQQLGFRMERSPSYSPGDANGEDVGATLGFDGTFAFGIEERGLLSSWVLEEEHDDEGEGTSLNDCPAEVESRSLGQLSALNISDAMKTQWEQLLESLCSQHRSVAPPPAGPMDRILMYVPQLDAVTPNHGQITSAVALDHTYAATGCNQPRVYDQTVTYDIRTTASVSSVGYRETRVQRFQAVAQASTIEAASRPNMPHIRTYGETREGRSLQHPRLHDSPIQGTPLGERDRYGPSQFMQRNKASRPRPTPPYAYTRPHDPLRTSHVPAHIAGQPFKPRSSARERVDVHFRNEWQHDTLKPQLPPSDTLDLSGLAFNLPPRFPTPCPTTCMDCHETLQAVDGIPPQRDVIESILEAVHVIKPSWDILSTALTFFKYLHYHDAWPRNFRYRSALDQVVFTIVHIFGTAPYNRADHLQSLLVESLPEKDWTPVFATFYPTMFVCPFAPCEMNRHLRGLRGYDSFNGGTHRIMT